MDWGSDDAIGFPRSAEEHGGNLKLEPQDRVLQNHQNKIICHESRILKSKLRDSLSRLGGYGICGIRDLFFKFFEK